MQIPVDLNMLGYFVVFLAILLLMTSEFINPSYSNLGIVIDKKLFSRVAANGIAVSRLATLLTGASSHLNACSLIQAAISAPMPPVSVSS